MHAESLEFGMMFDPNTMMSMYKVRHTPKAKIHFRQNMLHREIIVQFQLDIRDHRVPPGNLKISQLGKYNRTETLRFRLPFSQLQVVRQPAAEVNKLVMLISMESPPKFFKLLDALKTHDENARFWSDGDAWYRQTDVVYAPNALKNFPLTLKKTRPIIDLGEYICSDGFRMWLKSGRAMDHLPLGV